MSRLTKLDLQRAVRHRAERIRLANMQFVQTKTKRITPFSELPEPTYMLRDNADLEQFLLRNNLFHALETYRAEQSARASAQA